MALWSRKHLHREDIDPATALGRVLEQLRQDRTEARFQVLAAEADLRHLEEETARSPSSDDWPEQVAAHRQRINSLRQALDRLEAKVGEAERQADSLAARARSARARVTVAQLMTDLGKGDAADIFDRIQRAVWDLESEAEAAEEIQALGKGPT